MSRNNTWRFAIVILIVLWSLFELFPPQGRDLAQFFREKAQIPPGDTTFSNIVVRLQDLQRERPGQTYSNLLQAIGTNDVTRYFPFFDVTNQASPTAYVLNRLQREAAGRVKLGLDLQGGTSVLVQMDTNQLFSIETVTNKNTGQLETKTNRAENVKNALSQAVEVLRKRVDRFGVAEPVIQPVGSDEILVQLPGLSEADRQTAIDSIKKAAFLEFKQVLDNSSDLIKEHLVPPGCELLRRIEKSPNGSTRTEEVIVRKKPLMSGEVINSAWVQRDNLGQPQIGFSLTTAGAREFGRVTRELAPTEGVYHCLAIVLDGELYSAPRINEPIENGRGEITGQFDQAEAFELANVLQNPLKAPLSVLSSDDVDPTLGKDSIKSGIMASVVGVLAVAGFMAAYYLFAGMVANVALIMNIIILLGVMCSVGTTLTLPGIAGMVLTAGMAVDANVLIYERIREESAKGKSLRGAVIAGYARAFNTIFDSHVTTLISSVILIFMGTGSVKGFGVALTIGVAASLFTALVVTRLLFDYALDRGRVHLFLFLAEALAFLGAYWFGILKLSYGANPVFALLAIGASITIFALIVRTVHKVVESLITRGALPRLPMERIRMLHLIRGTKIDFMRWALPAFVGSWTLILVGNAYGVFARGHNVLGVEFAGGVEQVYRYTQAPGAGDTVREDVAKALAPLNLGEITPAIQKEKATGTRTLRLVLPNKGGVSDAVQAALREKLPQYGFSSPSVKTVGPVVAAELVQVAVVASLLAMLGILVYVAVRYEFSFAIGAVLAIVHDILMTLGCYFLSGRQLNATTVAAVLTIIGFSTNDTIVIFDRIREDLKLGLRGTFKEVMNQALNQTLSRTLITSGTVFIATAALYWLGGGPINDFAYTFLVGIITGTYSSIYIASALVLWWHKGQRPAIGSGVVMQTDTAGTPAPQKA